MLFVGTFTSSRADALDAEISFQLLADVPSAEDAKAKFHEFIETSHRVNREDFGGDLDVWLEALYSVADCSTNVVMVNHVERKGTSTIIGSGFPGGIVKEH